MARVGRGGDDEQASGAVLNVHVDSERAGREALGIDAADLQACERGLRTAVSRDDPGVAGQPAADEQQHCEQPHRNRCGRKKQRRVVWPARLVPMWAVVMPSSASSGHGDGGVDTFALAGLVAGPHPHFVGLAGSQIAERH